MWIMRHTISLLPRTCSLASCLAAFTISCTGVQRRYEPAVGPKGLPLRQSRTQTWRTGSGGLKISKDLPFSRGKRITCIALPGPVALVDIDSTIADFLVRRTLTGFTHIVGDIVGACGAFTGRNVLANVDVAAKSNRWWAFAAVLDPLDSVFRRLLDQLDRPSISPLIRSSHDQPPFMALTQRQIALTLRSVPHSSALRAFSPPQRVRVHLLEVENPKTRHDDISTAMPTLGLSRRGFAIAIESFQADRDQHDLLNHVHLCTRNSSAFEHRGLRATRVPGGTSRTGRRVLPRRRPLLTSLRSGSSGRAGAPRRIYVQHAVEQRGKFNRNSADPRPQADRLAAVPAAQQHEATHRRRPSFPAAPMPLQVLRKALQHVRQPGAPQAAALVAQDGVPNSWLYQNLHEQGHAGQAPEGPQRQHHPHLRRRRLRQDVQHGRKPHAAYEDAAPIGAAAGELAWFAAATAPPAHSAATATTTGGQGRVPRSVVAVPVRRVPHHGL
ncbi:hypothetical protein ON010_g6614 [Phytophthora cinnamomi]|nr:hypothetical protein ON010_g6614 [Phytophthora cinnamomi]